MREQVRAAAEGIGSDVLQLQEQLRALERTATDGECRVARAERELRRRAGGLDERRFARACVRRRICSVAEATARARAVRRQASVREAVDELVRVRQRSRAALAIERAELARVAAAVVARGALGVAASGVDLDVLTLLAKGERPARSQRPNDPTRSADAAAVVEQPGVGNALAEDPSRMSLDKGEDR